MSEVSRLLLVEDDPGDAELVREALSQPGQEFFEICWGDRLSQGLQLLEKDLPELVILDLSLPDAQGLDAFHALHEAAPQVPIIVLTGLEDEQVGMEAVRRGAQDYLIKGHLTDPTAFLRRVVRYAIERHRVLLRFQENSLTDELTGLYNRRGFFTLAEQQIKLARRKKTEMVLLFADLDGLKEINDCHGHPRGDWALTRAAEILKATFRDSDILARVGGDEFVVLAVDAAPQNAEVMLSRLRRCQEESQAASQEDVRISMSLGFAGFDPTDPSLTIDHLIAKADQELYRSKARRTASRKVVTASTMAVE